MRISILNSGEIEMGALRLMGASTKRDDSSQIGFFGTGVKYSLAWLLRNGFTVKIYSGLSEIKVTTKPTTLRGKTFDEIYLNDLHTGITTDIGPKWEPWQIIRELYCNAVDEGGAEMSTMMDVKPQADKTLITIEGPSMLSLMPVLAERERYFISNRKPLDTIGEGGWKIYEKINPNGPLRIYRKGILVYENPNMSSFFDYDFGTDIAITEERQLKDFYVAQNYAMVALIQATNPRVLDAIFTATSKYFEHQCMYYIDTWYREIPEPLLAAARKYYIAPVGSEEQMAKKFKGEIVRYIRPELYDKLAKLEGIRIAFKHHTTAGSYEPEEMQKWQKEMVAEALAIIGPHMDVDVPIEYVSFARNEIVAVALSDKILLSSRAFGEGSERPIHDLVSTLIEELIHYHKLYRDNSRQMQTELCNLAATAMLAFRDKK